MTPEPAPPPRRRRWLRLSVRALLALVAALAIALGWWSHLAHEQAAAVAAIRAVDPQAGIQYDNEPPGRGGENDPINLVRSPWVPEALERWLGVDYFFRVRILGLGKKGTELSPADRRQITNQLGRLPHLKQLVVPFPIDDADLAPLARMTELKDLILGDSNPGLTDRTLAVIGRLSRLEELEIGDTSVTDAGLAHLAHLSRLENLSIGDASVTDAGLAHLARLDQLQTLFIGHPPRAQSAGAGRVAITGSGFTALGRLPHLRLLQLFSTTLSGPGLAGIGRLTHLKELALGRYGDDPSPRSMIADLRALTPLDNLGALGIEGFGGDATSLVHLKGIKNLVSFMAPGLGDEAIPTLLELPALRSLTFKKHHLTAGGLAALRANPRFRSVGVDRLPTAPPAASPP